MRACLRGAPYSTPLWGWIVPPFYVRLGWSWLPVTNTLAYYWPGVAGEKRFCKMGAAVLSLAVAASSNGSCYNGKF
jgi:hypothetical protein